MTALSVLLSELAYLRGALRTLNRVKPIKSTPTVTILDRLDEVIARNHRHIALISDHETMTYGEMGARINRIARWAKANGIKKGDTVALFLPNRPDYLCIWLGIARAGGATALLNTSQTGHALMHSVTIVKPKLAIVADELLDTYHHAMEGVADAPRVVIVLGGLGVSTAATDDAIAKLPAPVTFAFAPYGPEVDRAATRARRRSRDPASASDGAVRISR